MMQYFPYIIASLLVDVLAAKNSTHSSEIGLEAELPTSHYKNIKSLNLVNNNLLIITKETFNKYQKLQELNIINSGVSFIADEAFYEVPQLKQLNLTKNLISRLSSTMFRPRNKLWKLVVSHNMLNNIDAFDISYFPELSLFDISNNHIRSLPYSLVNRIKQNPNFTLIGTNNPWDCRRGNWSSLLNKQVRQKICEQDEPKFEALKIPVQASFITCIFYTAGAFWIGIIVGNVCLLRRVLYPKKKKVLKKDQATQYHFETFRSNEAMKVLQKEHSTEKNTSHYL